MPFLGSVEGQFGYGRPRQPAAVASGGSMLFAGTTTSHLSLAANNSNLQMGTGNFTIEWFQYMQTAGGQFQRVFSIGSFSSQSIAWSQEGNDTTKTLYAWLSSANVVQSNQNITNQWVHFAIVRNGTTTTIYRNGTSVATVTNNTTNFNNTTDVLRIGNESTVGATAAFKGYITNMRWVKGTAVYTTNFTRPAAPLTAISGTVLLLLANNSGSVSTDSSPLANTVTNTGVTWSTLTPF